MPLLIGNHQKTAERIDYGRGARYLPIHVFIHVEADTVPILLLVLTTSFTLSEAAGDCNVIQHVYVATQL